MQQLRCRLNVSLKLSPLHFNRFPSGGCWVQHPMSASVRLHSHDHGHSHEHGHSCCGGSHFGHSHGAHAPSSFELEKTLPPEHINACKRITVVGALCNGVLAVGKVGMGVQGGSVSLYADGLHSLVDLITDCVAYVSLVLATLKVKRHKFPVGAGRVETLSAICVSVLLILGSLAGVWQAIKMVSSTFFSNGIADEEKGKGKDSNEEGNPDQHDGECKHQHHDDNHGHSHGFFSHGHSHQIDLMSADGSVVLWGMVAVCLSSLIVKEYLYHVTKRIGKKAGSAVVVANAYHHRADAWSSGVALIGVIGKCAGVPLVDAVGGIVVGGIVVKMTTQLLVENVCELLCFQSHETNEILAGIPRVLGNDKIVLMNAFIIRHGRRTTVHGTLLLKDSTVTAQEIVIAINEVKQHLRTAAHVPDGLGDLKVDIRIVDPTASFLIATQPRADGACSLEDVKSAFLDYHALRNQKRRDGLTPSPNAKKEWEALCKVFPGI